METTTAIAIALQPILTPIFFFMLVAPIAWLLHRVIPPGRLKVFLFRVRTGSDATRRDKQIITVAAVVAYAAFFAWIGFLSGWGAIH